VRAVDKASINGCKTADNSWQPGDYAISDADPALLTHRTARWIVLLVFEQQRLGSSVARPGTSGPTDRIVLLD
jgi:hypothetical protein